MNLSLSSSTWLLATGLNSAVLVSAGQKDVYYERLRLEVRSPELSPALSSTNNVTLKLVKLIKPALAQSNYLLRLL